MKRHFITSDRNSVVHDIHYVVGDAKKPKKAIPNEPELIVGDKPFLKKDFSVVRKTKFRGLPINIEIDTGMEKRGVGPGGKKWSHVYKFPYGEIHNTEGFDKDPVDIYLGPNKQAKRVFIVHQKKPNGSFDEDKCFIGFNSLKQAVKCYKDHGPPWGFGSTESMTFDQFKNGYLASNRREGFKKSSLSLIIRSER